MRVPRRDRELICISIPYAKWFCGRKSEAAEESVDPIKVSMNGSLSW